MNEKENKLIAEFMGGEHPLTEITHEAHHNYHTSWDWLMPVLIKIADMLEATHYPLYRSIDEAYDEAVQFIKEYNNG
tara:strand:- start:148 stop:378 length:231 start_codon:yes stop_codon:yes gene_type:complete